MDEGDGDREGFLGASGPAMGYGSKKGQRRKPIPLSVTKNTRKAGRLVLGFFEVEGGREKTL